MRPGWLQLLFLAIVLVTAIAWLVSGPLGFEGRVITLANRPDVSSAFQDPESGRSDAMVALVAFAVLGPIVAGILLFALVLVMKGVETALVTVRLPGWLSVPIVVVGGGYGVYVTSSSWLPQSLYAAGLVSRAYLVYAYGTVPVIH